jgi:ElaB/YqjD/DUF883 family membrane-anchored ribosome-binding protein
MIDMARKASQQSQALRTELRNVMKKAKDDMRKKQDKVYKNLDEKIHQPIQFSEEAEKQQKLT